MSFDARGMIEVNRQAILAAAAEADDGREPGVVLSVATWGRGARQSLLQALEPYRHGVGFNGSVVARVPRSIAAELLERPDLVGLEPPGPGHVLVVGMAFKELCVEWLALER